MADRIRLAKLISDRGLASRREAERLIEAGEVKVNGAVAKLGDRVNPNDTIMIGRLRVGAWRLKQAVT